MKRAILLLPLIAFLLAACAEGQDYRSAPGLRFGSSKKVDGREYVIGRIAGEENLFYVTPKRGASNDEREIFTAVGLYSGCSTHEIVERRDQGRTYILKGLLCPGQ